jgi:hypothetical protein
MSTTDLPVPPDESPEDQPVADPDAVAKEDQDQSVSMPNPDLPDDWEAEQRPVDEAATQPGEPE